MISIKQQIYAIIAFGLTLPFYTSSWANQDEAKKLVPVVTLILDNAKIEIPTPSSGTFIEEDGLIVIETESLELPQGWTLKDDDNDAIDSYIEWTNNNTLQTPGNGLITAKVFINAPGTYQFAWRNSIRDGDEPTESNDSFLKILADNFYGFRSGDGSIVCPVDKPDSNRCDGRDPEGTSKDGWFKVYRSGGNPPNDWLWVARTSDSDAHTIYADFDQIGEYEIQISGRSKFHAIDRLVLFRSLNDDDNITLNFATNGSRPESEIAP